MPCLLLQDGALVKTVKFKNPDYIGDPINVARIYNEFEVDELIFLDISASKERRHPPFDVISQISSECFMPVTYGGGITTLEDIGKIFSIGVEKVAINTSAIENPGIIEEASFQFGCQSIVVSIDIKKNLWGEYKVYGGRRSESTGLDPVQWAVQMEQRGAGELLVTSIDRDGTWGGYDIHLIRGIADAVRIPVIACGGAGSLEDLTAVIHSGGASAAAVGSMAVYQKKDFGVLINFPSRQELKIALR